MQNISYNIAFFILFELYVFIKYQKQQSKLTNWIQRLTNKPEELTNQTNENIKPIKQKQYSFSIITKLSKIIDNLLLLIPGYKKLYIKFRMDLWPQEYSIGSLILSNIVVIFLFKLEIIKSTFKMDSPILLLLIINTLFILALQKNLKKISENFYLARELPAVLEYMAKVYKINPDITYTIYQTSKRVKNPKTKQLLKEAYKMSQLGYSSIECFEYISDKTKSKALKFVVNSIKISQPLGADISEIFFKTASILRHKEETEKEINNLMFQSKLTGIVLSLAPILMFIFTYISDKNYQQTVTNNPKIKFIFFLTSLWWMIGTFITIKLSKIKV